MIGSPPFPPVPDKASKRTEKLQIMLSDEELDAIENWRYLYRLPSRAAAIRDLIRRGISNAVLPNPPSDRSSGEFGVVIEPNEDLQDPK
ncbi:MAG: hypothetical protein WEB63_09560 [Cucumibacter sp.]